MSNETKSFPLSAVLTITTGWLLTSSPDGGNGIGQVYEILNWMTNDNLFTHQLPRACRECEPWLGRWFPELAAEGPHVESALDGVAKEGMDDAIVAYLFAAKSRGCKDAYDVPRIPRDDHDVKDPVSELVEMRGGDHGVIVVWL